MATRYEASPGCVWACTTAASRCCQIAAAKRLAGLSRVICCPLSAGPAAAPKDEILAGIITTPRVAKAGQKELMAMRPDLTAQQPQLISALYVFTGKQSGTGNQGTDLGGGVQGGLPAEL